MAQWSNNCEPEKRQKRMLTYDDHFSVLQSALEFQSKIDGNIHFFCSDGRIDVRSTHLKVHSKLLSQIIPNNAQFEGLKASSPFSRFTNELTVLLPDVRKSHIEHLMNLITFGKIQFSVTKLDEIDSFSDVISEVLSTHLLDIKITNYGLRTAAWQRDGLLGRRRRRRDGRAAQARRGQDRGGGQRSQKGSAVS